MKRIALIIILINGITACSGLGSTQNAINSHIMNLDCKSLKFEQCDINMGLWDRVINPFMCIDKVDAMTDEELLK